MKGESVKGERANCHWVLNTEAKKVETGRMETWEMEGGGVVK